MSDNPSLGFAKFVPGFDFLQNLAKGAGQSMPQLPSLSSWVAPTLSVEELDKRIEELKAVQFWLDQNAKALSATVQALQVQRMTLSTLQGMNVTMGDLANALKLKPGAFAMPQAAAPAATPAPEPAAAPEAPAKPARRKASAKAEAPKAVDPLQWWGSLTQQFQQIAASAMADAARSGATEAAMAMATGVAKEAAKAATGAVRKAASPAAKAAAPRKSAKRGTRGAA